MEIDRPKFPDRAVITEDRPKFPDRALITAGMPYGNKNLHFGHVGGVFIHADAFARFLRDRIGKENVIFISGTDCYGSPIVEHYRNLIADKSFEGTIENFIQNNHDKQKDTLKSYHVSLDLYAASGLGRAAEIHREVSKDFFETLHSNGHLVKLTTSQFYDTHYNVFLNGRQVVGECPIAGCLSEKSYADECSLGHQYMPKELINPKSTLSGEIPEMRDISNWYFNLVGFHTLLMKWVEELKQNPFSRSFVTKIINEFLMPPVIYVKKEYLNLIQELPDKLPAYSLTDEQNKNSVQLIFDNLENRDKACLLLAKNAIRYRTGKTLVPFRLTGNIEWGVPAPSLEGLENLTFWVWPESLWAPISFTRTYLESQNKDKESWKEWWCSKNSQVYQFIGEDNVYFYGPAEMAMFMGQQGNHPDFPVPGDALQLPELIVNYHILFLDKKASSSSDVKPPMADDLLNYYTADQLRAHFLGLGLGMKNIGFQPKPFNPKATDKDSDPVLKEGNLLSNSFNRAVRSCFYTVQKYYDGKIPGNRNDITPSILEESRITILEYERLMYKHEFHSVMNLLSIYINNINKYWANNFRTAEQNNDAELRTRTLIDTFHMVRTATVLLHPIAPVGTEMILEYLNLSDEFWNWNRIFQPLYDFFENPSTHKLKFLEPRVDFFRKHPSQIQS